MDTSQKPVPQPIPSKLPIQPVQPASPAPAVQPASPVQPISPLPQAGQPAAPSTGPVQPASATQAPAQPLKSGPPAQPVPKLLPGHKFLPLYKPATPFKSRHNLLIALGIGLSLITVLIAFFLASRRLS